MDFASIVCYESLMMMTTANIFEFTNYRSFLSAYYEDSKKKNLRWSYEVWTRKLGLKNNSSIIKIICGQREPGPKITRKLVDYFKFNNDQKVYFEDLIRLSKAKKDPALSVTLMQKIQKQFPHCKQRLLDNEEFSAISHWWFYAVRQMTKLKMFTDDPKWISKNLNFKVPPKEIRKAINILLRLGLLEREEKNHNLKFSKENIQTATDIASEAIKRFHEEMLLNARSAIRSVNITEREISGQTITISKDNISKARALIRAFEEEFCNLFDTDRADEVYQLNIQFFPLTHVNKVGILEKAKTGGR